MERGLVLVIEDEVLIRMVATDIIEEAGYGVLEATHATEALTIVEARTDIAIVFTDINMPGTMDGLALAQTIKRRWPAINIIVTSGRASVRAEDMPIGGVFLAKPYTAKRLGEVLGSLSR